MLQGTVKSFDREKGWGFINVPNEGEIFVHYTGIDGRGLRILTPGEQVSLVIVQGKRGSQAAHVQRLSKRGF
ncbi:cold-shock protein [Limosilactobacillus fastidiosus]|uniref:Cold shock domain-containing protein n=1 Tax=Limosilactobacillus fastidiosus TaxID=2759855 RepID=A0A7W3YBS9_9LACO|nr:cold shock domain-containing protein [Limosilactobacillus fastidiosus]MBB1062351.1 cold shock domain-containing protein [Limosilactobacillus fastidiosus]MBB1085262.1 cold shock domain-containing protein [Limosilactobacillus fastidiosus]MCD7083427.1 cold shock domain-containing protein [Limosilactobacillus fastidiosus]MCD7085247.1 cold shock domain-containing protein [Limosilactobacillus fastidiosus]MCD7115190.1 cold shock domain-containing protein [Limosilactobacillus fastidiosus]